MNHARITRTADGLSYRVTFPFDRSVVSTSGPDEYTALHSVLRRRLAS